MLSCCAMYYIDSCGFDENIISVAFYETFVSILAPKLKTVMLLASPFDDSLPASFSEYFILLLRNNSVANNSI